MFQKYLKKPPIMKRQHAKDHLLLLDGIGDTVANLKEAIEGEDYEVQSMYPKFVREAEAEGNKKAAKRVQDRSPESRPITGNALRKLLAMVESGNRL